MQLIRGYQADAEDPGRTFCVYATGEADRPNHADIVMSGIHRYKRSRQNRIAQKIVATIMRNIETIEEFKSVADLSQYA